MILEKPMSKKIRCGYTFCAMIIKYEEQREDLHMFFKSWEDMLKLFG